MANQNRDKTFSLRDFTHAAQTFTSTPGYTLAPKVGFTFHVRLVFNQVGKQLNGEQSKTLSVLVKSVDLPKSNVETETLNKYNRKEVVQKKIVYEPVQLNFHDDVDNNVRDMWLAYQQYYYADSNLTFEQLVAENTYKNTQIPRYGLDNGQSERFLKTIEIYSMGNHVYTKYTLINPMIVSFDLDTHDYAEGGKTMASQMRVEYEAVKFSEGQTETIPGFGQTSPYYDNQYSFLEPGDLTRYDSFAGANEIEQEIFNAIQTKVIGQFDVTKSKPVALTPLQLGTITAEVVNSVQSNRRFSFPTAQTTRQANDLVSLNNTPTASGKMSRSNAVTSNGRNVSTGQISTIGSVSLMAPPTTSILVYPTVPAGLSSVELDEFASAYPALPSTDPRVKSPPYV